MHFDLKRPCPKCPFRTDIEPFLRADRVAELEDEMVRRQGTFTCHATLDYDNADEDGEPARTEGEQHCAGALILLEKTGQPNQLMRIMERIGQYDRTKLDMDAPVYESFRAMKMATRKANRLRKAKR